MIDKIVFTNKVYYMNGIRTILPLLLRFPGILTEEDKSLVKKTYDIQGKESVDAALKKEKQCRPFASEILAICNCDSDYWVKVHEDYVSRNTAIISILQSVFITFHKKGGSSLNVYENYGSVLSSGLTVGNFASGDVDFTVEDDEAEIAIEALHENGFFEGNRSDHVKPSASLVTPFFNTNALGGKGYWLNIFWKPIARDFMLRQDKYLERLSSLRRGQLDTYKDTEIKLLPPTAMVYFNALHFACEHHYSASPGMALCCDMDRVIRTREIDWDRLVRWSKEDNAGLRLRLALDICHYFLKTEVPLEKFGEPSKIYRKLWNRIIDEENGFLISQDGKLARLTTELLSDDMPLMKSLITRLWRR